MDKRKSGSVSREFPTIGHRKVVHHILAFEGMRSKRKSRKFAKRLRCNMPRSLFALESGDYMAVNRHYSPLTVQEKDQGYHGDFDLEAIPEADLSRKDSHSPGSTFWASESQIETIEGFDAYILQLYRTFRVREVLAYLKQMEQQVLRQGGMFT